MAIDATTLEANAALRSIVRRDDGRSYESFLDDLAKASGVETPTREDRAKIDKKRKKKVSNTTGRTRRPGARITRMKDGRTHLAHKAEHATDLDTTAIVGVTVQPADRGDTQSVYETLAEAPEEVKTALPDEDGVTEVVLDKGYHSNDVVADLTELDLRTYASEPDRGRRSWAGKTPERDAVYANRRRVKGERGQALGRRRGEVAERGNAHCYETGGLRRVHVRGRDNVLKRVLIQAGSRNLGLLMRSMLGVGTPKGLTSRLAAALARVCGHESAWRALLAILACIDHPVASILAIGQRRQPAIARGAAP